MFAGRSTLPPRSSARKPRPPPPGFSFRTAAVCRRQAPPSSSALMLGSRVGDGEARADGQRCKLIDRVAAGAPVRQLLFIEALGHARMPFAGVRADHRAGIELAAIDAHRAAEAAADLECGLDDGVAREARGNWLEIGYFPGRTAAGHSVPPRWVKRACGVSSIWAKTARPACVLRRKTRSSPA